MRGSLNKESLMTTTKEEFHEVTAELSNSAILLTQPDFNGENSSVLMRPLQLRHFAERFAGMEPIGWATSQPVKTLARRLHTLAFHIDFLYDYIKNHSDHKHADLSWELAKVTALSEMADEFCADLPDELCETDDEPTKQPSAAPIAGTTTATPNRRTKPKQAFLI
jgi:hypothetical protein